MSSAASPLTATQGHASTETRAQTKHFSTVLDKLTPGFVLPEEATQEFADRVLYMWEMKNIATSPRKGKQKRYLRVARVLTCVHVTLQITRLCRYIAQRSTEARRDR